MHRQLWFSAVLGLLFSFSVVANNHSKDNSIADLWSGAARLELARPLVIEPPADAAGSGWVVVYKQRWYWFYRDQPAAPRPTACGYDYVRTVVRSSADGGATWSEKTVVAEPDHGTCTTLDGATYLDTSTDTWHLLAQCLGREDAPGGRAWHLCHFTRANGPQGPAGVFTPDAANPVVRGGALFSSICARPGAHCPAGVVDEGTPEILGRDTDGAFLLTFHGAYYAGNNIVDGFRGAARTRDFQHYETSGGSLPGDVLLSAHDCPPFEERCAGAGAATTLHAADGFWYQLAETPTRSIGCTPGQFWPFTLFRAPRLAGSGGWELPGAARVPFLKPSSPDAPCGLQYARWIDDPDRGLHLAVWDAKLGHRLYRVVSTRK